MRTRTTPSTTEHHPQDLGTFPCAGSQPAWGCSPVSLLPPCAFTQRPRAGLATLRPGPALFCPPSLPKTRLPASPATPSSLLPARQPASAVCRRQVHTHTPRETNSDATKLFCKNPNCAPLVPPPERRRAGYNQESLQLRVTSDSLCYLPCPATVPAGRLTAARPRLEQRALPARAHPRTGDTVGLPRGSNTQKYLLCQRVPAAESQSPVFRGILSVRCCLLRKPQVVLKHEADGHRNHLPS